MNGSRSIEQIIIEHLASLGAAAHLLSGMDPMLLCTGFMLALGGLWCNFLSILDR